MQPEMFGAIVGKDSGEHGVKRVSMFYLSSCNIFSAAANKQTKKNKQKKNNKKTQQNSNKKTTPYFKVNFYLSKFVNIVKFYWFHRRKIFILIGICESKVFCHNNALCVSNNGKPSCFCRGGFEGPTCAFGKFLL